MGSNNKIDDYSNSLSLAYIHLGRVALLADDPERALYYFESAQSLSSGSIRHALDLMITEADRCASLGDGRAAIQRWQDILCLFGDQASDYMYQRLSEASASNREGFGGSSEENRCWGDCHKHDVLEWLHRKLQPDLYLEIGVDQGLSLARAKGRAIGVDPRLQLKLNVDLPTTSQILPLSSDAYFRGLKVPELELAPDLVFIDGMHLFEFALRDFINVERYSAPGTLVVIDDIYPCHPVQAARRRKSGAWTGDIWKLHSVLRELRPDLTLVALNSYTTGLLLIAGLDSESAVLSEHYEEQVRHYKTIEVPPQEVLERQGAIPSAHPLVEQVVNVLAHSKQNGATVDEVQSTLLQLQPYVAETEAKFMGQAQDLSGYCGLPNAFTAIGECEGSTVFQVFFPEAKNPHYRVQASQRLRLPVTGEWITYCIDIPEYADLTQYPLRIDPATRVGTFSIEWMRLVEKTSHAVLYSAQLPEEFEELRLSEGLQRVESDSFFTLHSTNSDPQLYLPLLSVESLSKTEGVDLMLDIRICFYPSSNDSL